LLCRGLIWEWQKHVSHKRATGLFSNFGIAFSGSMASITAPVILFMIWVSLGYTQLIQCIGTTFWTEQIEKAESSSVFVSQITATSMQWRGDMNIYTYSAVMVIALFIAVGVALVVWFHIFLHYDHCHTQQGLEEMRDEIDKLKQRLPDPQVHQDY